MAMPDYVLTLLNTIEDSYRTPVMDILRIFTILLTKITKNINTR